MITRRGPLPSQRETGRKIVICWLALTPRIYHLKPCMRKTLSDCAPHPSPPRKNLLYTRAPKIKEAVEKAIEAIPSDTIAVPDDLDQRVRDYLEENPECPWEEAVAEIVKIGGES
jgi:hypothetical protein